MQADWLVRKERDSVELILETSHGRFSIFDWFHWSEVAPYLNVLVPQAILTHVQMHYGTVNVEKINVNVELKSSNGRNTLDR